MDLLGKYVEHVDTENVGTATARCDKLHPWDNEGPWLFVRFDDGLNVWVPESKLQEYVIPTFDDLMAKLWE